jgi:hypothetical protein
VSDSPRFSSAVLGALPVLHAILQCLTVLLSGPCAFAQCPFRFALSAGTFTNTVDKKICTELTQLQCCRLKLFLLRFDDHCMLLQSHFLLGNVCLHKGRVLVRHRMSIPKLGENLELVEFALLVVLEFSHFFFQLLAVFFRSDLFVLGPFQCILEIDNHLF